MSSEDRDHLDQTVGFPPGESLQVPPPMARRASGIDPASDRSLTAAVTEKVTASTHGATSLASRSSSGTLWPPAHGNGSFSRTGNEAAWPAGCKKKLYSRHVLGVPRSHGPEGTGRPARQG